MEYREWWREFDDIDWRGGEPNFILNDDQDMIDVEYADGMLIDVGRDSNNIYQIIVEDSEKKGEPLCTLSFADRDKLHDKLQETIERFRERGEDIEQDIDINDRRAAELIVNYGLNFSNISRDEIVSLINAELKEPVEGSSEYIRLLCAYLFCIGGKEDAALIKKAKYSGKMDVGAMIDSEWITSLENGGQPDEYTRSREELIADIITYYVDFEDRL